MYPIGKGWHLRVIGTRDATIQGDISLEKNPTINICLDIPLKVQLSSLFLVIVLTFIYLLLIKKILD